MTEHNIQVLLKPETYDYHEEEIAYRIFCNEQLISERSCPLLQTNQILKDVFNIVCDENEIIRIYCENIKQKKIKISKVIFDELYETNGQRSIDKLQIRVTTK